MRSSECFHKDQCAVTAKTVTHYQSLSIQIQYIVLFLLIELQNHDALYKEEVNGRKKRETGESKERMRVCEILTDCAYAFLLLNVLPFCLTCDIESPSLAIQIFYCSKSSGRHEKYSWRSPTQCNQLSQFLLHCLVCRWIKFGMGKKVTLTQSWVNGEKSNLQKSSQKSGRC